MEIRRKLQVLLHRFLHLNRTLYLLLLEFLVNQDLVLLFLLLDIFDPFRDNVLDVLFDLAELLLFQDEIVGELDFLGFEGFLLLFDVANFGIQVVDLLLFGHFGHDVVLLLVFEEDVEAADVLLESFADGDELGLVLFFDTFDFSLDFGDLFLRSLLDFYHFHL